MAIGWMNVLKAVPWGQVISNAPAIADGAQKLWKTVRKSGPALAANVPPESPGRADGLAARVEELQRQMETSSELIDQLARQNEQLVARINWMQRRVHALGIVVGLFAVVLAVLAALLLAR